MSRFVILAISTAVLLVVGALLAFLLPQRAINARAKKGNLDIKDALAAENDMRATIFQALTALALVVGAGFTVYQIIDTAKTTRSQLNLAEESQLSQQFTQAVGQLASNSDEPTQLGGVYGLAKVARESPSIYRTEVINVLGAFVRGAAGQVKGSQTLTLHLAVREPSVQVALDTLLKPPALQRGDTPPLRLSTGLSMSLDLRLGDFTGDNLNFVFLEGDALDGASFDGSNLKGSCLYGVSVNNTRFQGAHLYGTDLSKVDNLKDAQSNRNTKYDQYTKWPYGFTKADQEKFGTEVQSARKPPHTACPQ